MTESLATTVHSLLSTGPRSLHQDPRSNFPTSSKNAATQKTRFGHRDSRQANALLIGVALVGNHDVVAETALYNSSIPAQVALLH